MSSGADGSRAVALRRREHGHSTSEDPSGGGSSGTPFSLPRRGHLATEPASVPSIFIEKQALDVGNAPVRPSRMGVAFDF